jgi:hypothetical protein
MIQANEKTAKSFKRIIQEYKIHYWNLYNPGTKEILKSSDLKRANFPFFNQRPDSWDRYGVLDLGIDWEHIQTWMHRVKKYLDAGWIFCTINKNISDVVFCDCKNVGFNSDEKGNVIPFSD